MAELESRGARGLTGRAVALGLLLVLVWLLYDCTLAVDSGLNKIEVLYLIGFGAIFTMFVVQALNNSLSESRRLSRQELTVIYAMVAVAIPWGILIRGALEAPIKMIVVYTGAHDPSLKWLTHLWVIQSHDAIELFRRGGCMPWQIPWGEWLPPILYWSGMLISFQLFAVFVVLFFRRIFIDEEKLPFPMAQVGQSIIEYRPSHSDEASARKYRTIVRVAFIVGLLFCVPGILSISPAGYQPIPMNSGYYSTRTGIIPGLSVTLSWDPFVLCFLMFFPLDVLFTVTIFYVGWEIALPIVCQWMGVPTPPVGEISTHVFGIGGLVGLAFWTLFFNRGLVWDGIRRGLQGGQPRDSNEPFGHRVVLVGLVLSFLAFMTLFVVGIIDWSKPFTETDFYANLWRHILSLFVCVFILVTLLVAIMRQSSEQGWHYHSPWSVARVLAYPHAKYFIRPTTLFRTPASFMSIGHITQFGSYHNTFAPHLHVFDALRVASHTETNTREIMKAVFLTLLVCLIVVVPGYLMLIHYYGFDRRATTDNWENFYNYVQPHHGMGYSNIPGFFRRIPPWVSIPIGVTIIGVVMYLRRERVRFPLSPVGIVISTAGTYFGSYSTSIIWLPIVIVLVVKRVIYRWFGVGFFKQKVVPVVMFLMMGMMTGMFIYKLVFASMGKGFIRPY